MGGSKMSAKWIGVFGSLALPLLCLPCADAQSFGAAKEKVLLQRKLPALAHLSGKTIKVKVTSHKEDAAFASDFGAQLETELLKNDPRLTTTENNPSAIILCQITDYSHPPPIATTQQALSISKKGTKTEPATRIPGTLSVAFQAKTAGGQTLISDYVTPKYDRTFDNSGNNITNEIKNSVTGGWKRLTGGGSSEDVNPPTDAELRSRLINDVVRQIASHVVNTNETLEVFLARNKGPLEEGDKDAMAG